MAFRMKNVQTNSSEINCDLSNVVVVQVGSDFSGSLTCWHVFVFTYAIKKSTLSHLTSGGVVIVPASCSGPAREGALVFCMFT